MAKDKKPKGKKKEQPEEVEGEMEEMEENEVEIDQSKQNVLDSGFGRFEYQNGTVYEGQWKEFSGVKMKHGEGYLVHSSLNVNDSIREEYKGTWKEDKMDGFGIYKYISGAIYTGEWKEDKHHGKGVYEFPDGSVYEGEWKNHRMHGEGLYIDKDNRKWKGEFVEGVYQSKLQKTLKIEKVIKRKKTEIQKSVEGFFTQFFEAFEASDKKTFKENLAPFFPSKTADDIRPHLREPYPKYEDRKPDIWNEFFEFIKENPTVKILQKASQSRFVRPNAILTKQFIGLGQIVEFEREEPLKQAKMAVCRIAEDRWMLVYHDLVEEKPSKK